MRQARIFLAVLAVALVGTVTLGQAKHKAPPAGGPINQLQAQVTALQATVANQQIQIATLQNQVAALQNSPAQTLAPFVSVMPGEINGLKGPHVIFTGANVHVRSGSGHTYDDYPGSLTGLGNLVVGYNELGPGQVANRPGAHNLVVGVEHAYSSFGGLVAGSGNTISGHYATVSGGGHNTASGNSTSVSGGALNNASGDIASISGGKGNTASGPQSSVSGGDFNEASGNIVSILGGQFQTATKDYQTIPALP